MYNLTSSQQNIWNLQKYYADTTISAICGAIYFSNNIDVETLKRAINHVIERQSGLRLRFHEADGKPVQQVSEYVYEEIPVVQFPDKNALRQCASQYAQELAVMTNVSLYHFAIFHLNGQSGVLAVLSHLISDAWTLSLLARQVSDAGQTLSQNIVCDSNAWDYLDHIRLEEIYFSSKRYQKDADYWQAKFAIKPEPSTIKIRTASSMDVSAKRITKLLDSQLTVHIQRFCEETALTPAVLFETAVILYLAKLNLENPTITIGTPVLGRYNIQEKNTVGMFVATMPLSIKVSATDTAEDLALRVTDGHRELFRHQRYPYSHILHQLREKHSFTGSLYDVMVSYQNAQTGVDAETEWFSNGYSETPFVLHIDDRDNNNSFTWTVDYQERVFQQEEEIHLIMARLEHILRQILNDSKTPIAKIGIIPTAEYQQMIFDFNNTAVEYPRDKCVHELFREQAAKTPEKSILAFEDQAFTYRQLDEMSNALAYALRATGLRRNDIVPIIAVRSWHIIVAMLGILKAGGAYMPVDPTYPSDRIEYMINAAKCGIAVTYGYREILDIKTIPLDDFDFSSDAVPVANINSPEDLCYVIFTSGSTGNPKGVSISHQNVLNYCHNNNNNNVCHAIIEANYRSVVSVTNIVFDIFVTESILPLLNGITIYFANDEQVFSQEQLSELISTGSIDVIQTTPTKMRSYIMDKQNVAYLKKLKAIVLGGEALPADLYKELLTYTNACIFNIYGPAETTVWSTNKKMSGIDSATKSFAGEKYIHQLFEAQAEQAPDKTALIACDKALTYQELNEDANRIAHSLIEMGIGVGDIVAFALPRRSYLLAVMFGILKTGAAYMPIDPNYPKDRIDYMLKDSQARLLITEESVLDLLKNDCVCNFPITVSANDSFCALHTSGSTGTPKVSLLKHSGIRNWFFANQCLWDGVEIAVSATIATFDAFMIESILTLAYGCKIVFASENDIYSQAGFVKLFDHSAKNLFFSTPTKLKKYIDNSSNKKFLQKIKSLIIGGEVFDNLLLKEIRKYSPSCRIYNIYGPTESTVCATLNEIKGKSEITIGKPIANTQIYILDRQRQPLPIGVAGELCISGDGVGQGYLNRPELTAEKFIPNPFLPGKTMYCTGDLARWRTDGELEFLGRIDTQVKIRGLRIELGEIESVMSQFPCIRMAAATEQRDTSGRQYLVGYYTSETVIDETALRQHLSAKLPKYMVPNYFAHLEKLPMTPSGKVDRKNLPLPHFTVQTAEYLPPETETEKQLSTIWSELLRMERVGRTDDFFELGGDSLMAISVLSRIKSVFQAELSIRDIMENSALERLADIIDRTERTNAAITPGHRGKYILLPQQKAIYAACQKNPQSLAYNMPVKVRLSDQVDRDKLIQCLEEVVNRHDSLKTRIISEGSEIYGVYDEKACLIAENYLGEDYSAFLRPFALETAPLVRMGFTEDSLLFDMHHVIADGDSLSIILREIVTLYVGDTAPISDVSYADYADYFQRADFSAHREYFKNMLRCDFEPVELPRQKGDAGMGGASLLFHLRSDVVDQGRKFARANSLTDTMLFLGAYGIMLSKYTGRADILSSIVLSNRTHSETAGVVGMFVNTLPVHLPVVGTVKEYFGKIRDLVLNLFQHQELPFLEIADAVGMSDKTVINTSFVYQAGGEKRLELDGEAFVPEWLDTKSAKFDLLFEVTPVHDGCTVRVEYNCTKYNVELVANLFAAYEKILTQLTKETISDISALSETEYQRVVYDFNDTTVDYPRDQCAYELFEQQVKRTPDKTALIFADKRYTYRKLDELSNGLAVSMIGLGIRQGDMVAVLLDRDEKVILAQLAVLKIGAVFIPIDSRYPEERIKYILSESGAKAIFKNADNELAVPQARNIEDLSMTPTAFIEHPLVDTRDTCYIIFTSGSTGKPKGCTLTNRGLVNFCRNNNILKTCNMLDRQICISVNTVSFDYFIAESLLPLTNGYTVVLASEEESVDQDRFINLAVSIQANIIQTTPTRFKLYFDEKRDLSFMQQFDVIVTSGEALPLELLDIFHRNSNAKIFNPLGPSECSVWAVGGELHLTEGEVTANDITIGKPISNTQIYILDQNQNPLPIGVAGELCISGDGVGNGYMNRPELTTEKFIQNPFLPGKTMYCTGDLARWREDGEIEFLGRIDTQVKIRGLRIELGEIENVMSQFPGISMSASASKEDRNGRQYLVGYYVADAAIQEQDLRQHLSAKLPRYMVPNYFVRLEQMPMTPSGKLDRRNLPSPEFSSAQLDQDYVPPRSEKERTLCKIIERLLNYTQVGIADNFFELGGDSLKAIEFVTKAHGVGIYIALQNVFDHPTVKSLCDGLQQRRTDKIPYELNRLAGYAPVLERNTWDPEFLPQRHEFGNVVLTGSTGFLGAHILDALMKRGVNKIYCLVRSSSEKLNQRLRYYFGDQYMGKYGKKIIPVAGDLETDGIGGNLPEHVDYVIHAAASVKHYGPWSYFKSANVDATRRIVTYAKKVNARFVHISTISVSGNDMADQFDVYVSEEEKYFSESSLYIGQPLDNVYVRSKFEAEMVVLDAMREGLRANIIRVGNLTNRKSDLKFQPNYTENAFLKRVKAVLDLGCIPDYLMSIYAEFSPVDSTAEAIVAIAAHMNSQYTVFHVNSNKNLYFDKMLEYLERAGYPIKVISGDQFAKRIRTTIDSEQVHIFEALSNDLDQDDKLQYESNIHIENAFTVQYLRSIGFEWPEIDCPYVEGYLRYFTQLGYFEGMNYEEK